MDKFSYLSNAESDFIEQQYNQYLQDPSSVEKDWQKFFEGFEFARKNYVSKTEPHSVPSEFKVINLINGYRQRGHLFTLTNPVRVPGESIAQPLILRILVFRSEDLTKEFHAGNEIGIGTATLSKIIDHLQQTYCQSIGVEFAYIRNEAILQWLKTRMESHRNEPKFGKAFKMTILRKLSESVFFEKFLHKRFPGQKRFSLEGGESLIPALEAIIEKGASLGAEEFLIGMPHRGRLNVLANIMGKPYRDIFNEFSNKEFDDEFVLGDVKYHLGATLQRPTHGGKTVNLTLAPNPSHLETVGPVVEGISRAKIDQKYHGDTDKVVPITYPWRCFHCRTGRGL